MISSGDLDQKKRPAPPCIAAFLINPLGTLSVSYYFASA